jgi:enterochelin esterase-like enzyme
VAINDHLFAALLGATIAATLFRRRAAAFAGALAYFVVSYLLPLTRFALHPGPSPAGLPQTIIPAPFQHMVLTVLGLGILFALVGAALGETLSELLVAPLVALGQRFVSVPRDRGRSAPRQWIWLPVALTTGVLLLVAAAVGIQGVNAILTYGPTLGLYQTSVSTKTGTGAVPIAHGTIQEGTYMSPALGGARRSYVIYLPPSYQIEAGNRYPVLYLLHGLPGTPLDSWVGAGQAAKTADALIALGKMREVILVSPDGNGPIFRASAWANSYDGRQRMEDDIVRVFVPYIDQHYRTLADRAYRGIGGLSEGGFGAANIGLHHPDVFGAVLSESGYFDAEDAVLGTAPAQAGYRLYNSPAHFITTAAGTAALSKLTFVICVGTLDGVYYNSGKAFAHQVLKLGGHVTLIQSVGGHTWAIWASQFGQAAPLLEPPAPVASMAATTSGSGTA